MLKYRRLIKQIREYLKKKLLSYSVPTLFVPLSRMPLNPNGKIDKPGLPFPDTAQAPQRTKGIVDASLGNATEETMRRIWDGILPNAPTPIPFDESFFDLGGHSILATRLIFEIRKAFVVNAPLGLVFDHPTVKELSAAIDSLRNMDLGLTYKAETPAQKSNTLTVPGSRPPTKDGPVRMGKIMKSWSNHLPSHILHSHRMTQSQLWQCFLLAAPVSWALLFLRIY